MLRSCRGKPLSIPIDAPSVKILEEGRTPSRRHEHLETTNSIEAPVVSRVVMCASF